MPLHWPLLQVAQEMIQKKSTVFVSIEDVAFDTKGVALLMERLAQLTTPDFPPEEDARAMQQSFQRALAQSFVAGNAKKSQTDSQPWKSKGKIESIRTTDLRKHDIGVQERVVQYLLDR